MEIDPDALSLDERYKLLSGCVVPRPIAFVSTLSQAGVPNLAPYSQFTFASVFPAALLFCVGRKPDKSEKDTVVNARPPAGGGTGEFVVNVVIEDYARDVSTASLDLASGVSEWELTSLHQAPSTKVMPCRVAEAPIAFECKTMQVVPVGAFGVVIGRIVHIHVRDNLVDSRYRIDHEAYNAIGRMAGNSYVRTHDRFDIKIADDLDRQWHPDIPASVRIGGS
ncbi:flavin reductase family protein [Bradyrhizobium diazoefficiens]|nr:flavin reductase family protein [Bradyrhizobium diazoefficiens]MBR0701962.1 flavin reductase family protein [Bradyrhizobium diazoefficiens]MBR0770385.1 flavin reductase family protein [Bradyrhizobium diazoefficiens]